MAELSHWSFAVRGAYVVINLQMAWGIVVYWRFCCIGWVPSVLLSVINEPTLPISRSPFYTNTYLLLMISITPDRRDLAITIITTTRFHENTREHCRHSSSCHDIIYQLRKSPDLWSCRFELNARMFDAHGGCKLI